MFRGQTARFLAFAATQELRNNFVGQVSRLLSVRTAAGRLHPKHPKHDNKNPSKFQTLELVDTVERVGHVKLHKNRRWCIVNYRLRH